MERVINIDAYRQRINSLLERIKNAATSSGRCFDDIKVVAVSKTQSEDAIRAAFDCGFRHFGENRAEELKEKANRLSDLKDIKWNFVGTLQSRQAPPVAINAHIFHAVDRIKIADVLSKKLEGSDKTLAIFVQVNVSGEETKHGFDCSAWETDSRQRDALGESLIKISTLPNLQVNGLMTMAPLIASEIETRNVFRRTKNLYDWLNNTYPEIKMSKLSMGMSGDFEIAIQEGATDVRIGSAIFKN
jgi:pyridoxal phosphate enzyme (YggS family)